MKLLKLKYIIVMVIILWQGTGMGNLFAQTENVVTDISAARQYVHKSDTQNHPNFEISNNSSRSVNQAEKVETVFKVPTDSNHTRIKQVNLLLIIHSAAGWRERFSMLALCNVAIPQTSHIKVLTNILKI